MVYLSEYTSDWWDCKLIDEIVDYTCSENICTVLKMRKLLYRVWNRKWSQKPNQN